MTATSRFLPIDALLAPASIAVVGASPNSFVGRILCQNLLSMGYPGRVYPVNPRYQEVLGLCCYASLDEAPGEVDAVVTAVGIDRVPPALRAAAMRGARAAVVPGGGFTETGPAALEAQRRIQQVAEEFGMAVAGPNCMGVVAPGRRSAMYIGTVPDSLLPGKVALVSQSGSVVEAAVNMGPRIGFSALVSCGTEAATTIGDYLRYLAEDDETAAVLVFLEGFRDAAGFVHGARLLREAGKPLAVLQAGRTAEAAAAVAAHSGTLAGSGEVMTGLLRQLGAIGVDDLDELFEVGELLGHGRLPTGRRAFVATDSGGEANLVADHAKRVGLGLPSPSPAMAERLRARWPNFSYIGNPIDPWGVDPDADALYGEIFRAAADEDVDVVALALDKVTPWAGEEEIELGLAGARALVEATAGTDKMPLYFTVHATGPAASAIREFLREARVPMVHGMRPALIAASRSAWWRAWRPRTPQEPTGEPVPVAFVEPGPILSELASREVLAAYGIPLVPAEAATTPEGAAAAAERLGFPVVVKAAVTAVAHKAAAGLVITAVPSRERVREAFVQLRERSKAVEGDMEGVLVESSAIGAELICGMRRDPLFGPVVLVGAGGTLTEAMRDISVRVCPVAAEDLDEMLDECAAGKLIAAAGGSRREVAGVVAALSRLALEHPEILEVDVNPLFTGPWGAGAADALVVIDTKGGTG